MFYTLTFEYLKLHKMKNKLFFLIFILFFSCNDSNILKDDISKIQIDALPENVYNFFDVVEDFQFIKLETVSDGLIGNIHKVIIVNDRIFILDRLMAKSVLCFDINGKFIRKIGNHGRGPGEWLNPVDIAYLDDSQNFVIYCHSIRKLIFYDLNGNYIKEINLGLSLKSFFLASTSHISVILSSRFFIEVPAGVPSLLSFGTTV